MSQSSQLRAGQTTLGGGAQLWEFGFQRSVDQLDTIHRTLITTVKDLEWSQ